MSDKPFEVELWDPAFSVQQIMRLWGDFSDNPFWQAQMVTVLKITARLPIRRSMLSNKNPGLTPTEC